MIRLKRISLKLLLSAAILIAAGFIANQYWHDSRRTSIDIEIQRVHELARSDEIEMAQVLDLSVVMVPAGDFIMGSDSGRYNETPQRSVYLDAFEMDRYEVTNAQYRRYLQATGLKAPPYWSGSNYPSGQADYPVVGVRWEDAKAYCNWAAKRLPTEAEWEKACRGTEGRVYPWGNEWEANLATVYVGAISVSPQSQGDADSAWNYAWQLLKVSTTDKAQPALQPVGSHPQGGSPYGIMDLVGSASEWVYDWYNWSDYSKMPDRNPVGQTPPWNHCVRGSAWYDPASTAVQVQDSSRCAARNSAHGSESPLIGFRCTGSASK
jgi:formylglycine-generating enzyme required for sulfatase activity